MILNVANGSPETNYNIPLYTCTGTAPQIKVDPNDDSNWEMAFLGNCTITFRRLRTPIDVCVVAGGKPGGDGTGNIWGDGYYARGGKGGKGGGVINRANVALTAGQAYKVVIGGSGQSSSAFGVSAASGDGSAGGDGAFERESPLAGSDGGDGSDGTKAFGANETTLFWNGYKYGAGGAGGGTANRSGGGRPSGDGGTSGGGDGGTAAHGSGYNGTTNSGSGGGGGYAKHDNTGDYWNGAGGKGGSGIVLIRNHRSS